MMDLHAAAGLALKFVTSLLIGVVVVFALFWLCLLYLAGGIHF